MMITGHETTKKTRRFGFLDRMRQFFSGKKTENPQIEKSDDNEDNIEKRAKAESIPLLFKNKTNENVDEKVKINNFLINDYEIDDDDTDEVEDDLIDDEPSFDLSQIDELLENDLVIDDADTATIDIEEMHTADVFSVGIADAFSVSDENAPEQEKTKSILDGIKKDDEQGLPTYIFPDDIDFLLARRFIKAASEPVYGIVKLSIKEEEIDKDNVKIIRYMDTDCALSFDKTTPVVVNGFEAEVNVLYRRPAAYYRNKAEPREFPFTCLCIVDDETLNMFIKYKELEDKYNAIKTFWKLSPSQKEYVRRQYSKPKYSSDGKEEEYFKPIQDKKSLEMMYKICRDTYSPEDRAWLDGLFEKLDSMMGRESKEDILTQISYKLCIDTDAIERKEKTYDEIMRIFDEWVYGMEELKERIAEYILAMQYSKANYFSILLVGSPGVGKTSFGIAISIILGCELAEVDCSGVNFIALGGVVKAYSGAQPGKISNALIEKGKTDLVLLLDEVDKLVADKDGDAFSALNKPLGPQRLLYDEFIADNIDMSNCKIICTANDIEKIPGYIVNRFEDNVFYIPDYTAEDKAAIAKNHLIPKEMKNFNVSSDDIVFTDEGIMEVASRYCNDEGARQMSGNVKSLIRKAIKGWYRGIEKKPTVIDVDFVRKHLKLPEKRNGSKNSIGFGGKLHG